MKKDDKPIDYASPDAARSRPSVINRARLAITTLVIFIAFAAYYPFSPAGVQRRQGAENAKFIPALERIVGQNPAFQQVGVGGRTDGFIYVTGRVQNAADLAAFQAVMANAPKAPRLRVRVFVASPEEWRALVANEPTSRASTRPGT